MAAQAPPSSGYSKMGGTAPGGASPSNSCVPSRRFPPQLDPAPSAAGRETTAAAVPEAEVQQTVGPEVQLAAVVVGLGLREREQLATRRGVGGAPAHRVLVDASVAALVRVVHVDLAAVGRE